MLFSKIKKSNLAVVFGLVIAGSSYAQNVGVPQQQDPLEELVPIGMVLELSKICKLKPETYSVITDFEKLSISLHDKYSEKKEVGKAKESFEKGKKLALELKPELKPGNENCSKVKATTENMNEALKTNLSILQLIVENEKKKK